MRPLHKHLFYPIAIKTSGVFGPDAYAIWLAKSKPHPNKPNSKEYIYLLRCRGNAASVLGCAGLVLDVVQLYILCLSRVQC